MPLLVSLQIEWDMEMDELLLGMSVKEAVPDWGTWATQGMTDWKALAKRDQEGARMQEAQLFTDQIIRDFKKDASTYYIHNCAEINGFVHGLRLSHLA